MHIESPEPVLDSVTIYIAQCHTAVATFDTQHPHTGVFIDRIVICIAHCLTAVVNQQNNRNRRCIRPSALVGSSCRQTSAARTLQARSRLVHAPRLSAIGARPPPRDALRATKRGSYKSATPHATWQGGVAATAERAIGLIQSVR